MIGLDLDGTLLNDKKELTSHTREILTRAIDQGVTVLAVSYTHLSVAITSPGDLNVITLIRFILVDR